MLFLPISFQLSSLSVGHHIFPIRGQFFHWYFFCQMTHFEFFSLLDCFSAFLFQFFYGFVSYFPNSVPLISLMSCTPTVKFQMFPLFVFSLLLLFQFPFFFSIVSESRTVPQYPALPPLIPNSSFHLAYLLFVSKWRVFLLSLSFTKNRDFELSDNWYLDFTYVAKLVVCLFLFWPLFSVVFNLS